MPRREKDESMGECYGKMDEKDMYGSSMLHVSL